MMQEKNYKNMSIAFPDGSIHPIIAQYIQVTKNGKYILNYLERKYNMLVPSFTEIIKVNNEWGKNPFHDDYDEYEFEEFDSELSNQIMSELPNSMRFKIKINDDRKVVTKIDNNTNNIEINSHGATEISDNIENNIYCILINNDGNIVYDFPFPSFCIEGKNNHVSVNYENDVNNGVEFNEIEFSRCGLSVSTRKKITEYLKKQLSFSKILDIQTVDIKNDYIDECYRIHFVECPDLATLSTLYKAKQLNVDCDEQDNLRIEELLTKAFNNELPLYVETEFGSKINNGVKHQVKTR